ncbi:hypothetical protein SYNPS1DRAFT_26673 [Syncephalis pseudoplumigaleata]|uniref:Fe2OG dioxygenase domain-containing protein n=1 Tax=Syncephalis pseudoplumigaleata TaxID=1712513 RepID=A0A4P9Z516_9FUNG|nr:hypothetical protein SYNPS1DRAFT_26673 [Syncephalis pseudoplumigaleata]|eukprot:RKP27683.1 hypothetical protein SYNPS1DRAFT_26673 [Syncephalis pseudoplumigaleata]
MTASVSLPIIDFQPMLDADADAAARKAVAQQIDAACRQYGFFYLVHHGIPAELQEAMRKQATQFFNRSPEEKVQYSKYGTVRGYHNYTNQAKLDENLQHEVLAIVQPLGHHRNGRPIGDDASTANADVFGPLMEIADRALRTTIEQYRAAIMQLGRHMLAVIAGELGATEFDFEWLRDPFCTIRMNYYPTCEAVDRAHEVGLKAHTDVGMLTFLDQDTHVTSLQIQVEDANGDSTWRTVEPVPGSLIVNLGDMMVPWSNGQYRSAMHRVIHPHKTNRHSIATFFDPRFDAMVPTLKETMPAGEAPRYPPGCYGDTVLGKIKDFYALSAKPDATV